MPLARFRIKCEAGEPAAIEVNGQQLPAGMVVLGLSLRADGPAPVLTLVVAGDGILEGEGIVQVERESEEDYRGELLAIVQGRPRQDLVTSPSHDRPSMTFSPLVLLLAVTLLGLYIPPGLRTMISDSVRYLGFVDGKP